MPTKGYTCHRFEGRVTIAYCIVTKEKTPLIHQAGKSNSRNTKSYKDIEGLQKITGMLSIRIFVSLIFIDAVCGQCEGRTLILPFEEIYGERRFMRSPHYPNEHGWKSNCTWDIILPATPHILVLHIEDLRLHYRVYRGYSWSTRHCLPSHKLLINGERLGCKDGEFVRRYVDAPLINTFPYCVENQRKLSGNEVHSRMRIQYRADGAGVDARQNAVAYAVTGFVISYTFRKCPYIHTLATTTRRPHALPTATKSTTANTQGEQKSVQSASEISETILQDGSINLANGGSPAQEQQTISTVSHTAHKNKGTDSIDPQASAEANDIRIIIAASIAGGVLVILIILVSWKIHRKKEIKKKKSDANETDPHSNLDDAEFRPYSMAENVPYKDSASHKSEIPNQPVFNNGEKLIMANVAYEASWEVPGSHEDPSSKTPFSYSKENILCSNAS